MVKKILSIGLILLFVINLAVSGYCDGPIEKLGRGLANVVTFPLEVPEQTARVNDTNGPFAAATVGVLKGAAWAIGRACVGVYETATFMLPYPKGYRPILQDPEYFLDSTDS